MKVTWARCSIHDGWSVSGGSGTAPADVSPPMGHMEGRRCRPVPVRHASRKGVLKARRKTA